MKKITVILLLLFLLSLTGCRAINDTEAAITAVGTVTMTSGDAISAAEELYAQLSDFERKHVENYDLLPAARETYEALHNQVSEAKSAIGAIGDVTLEQLTAITHARDLYEALNPEQKTYIDNLQVLTDAEAEYARLDGLVQSAKEAIALIGEVTLDSEKAIKAARTAYEALQEDSLTDYASDDYKVLTAAEKAYEKLLIEDMKTQAAELLAQGEYEQALEAYCTLLYGYPLSQKHNEYNIGAAEASVGIARGYYENGEVEDAKLTLENAIFSYTNTDNCRALSKEIEEYLDSIRPRNGKVFYKKFSSSHHQLKVIGGSTDMCIKLTRLEDNKSAMFYVRAGEKVTLDISDGEYQVEYAMGSDWYGEEEMFGKSTLYIRMEQPIEFESYRQGWTIYYTILTLDMTPSENGTMTPNIIPPEEF